MQLILSAVSSIVQKQLFTNDASRSQWVRGYLLAGNQRIFITLIFTISLEFCILSYKRQFLNCQKFIAQKMSRFYGKMFLLSRSNYISKHLLLRNYQKNWPFLTILTDYPLLQATCYLKMLFYYSKGNRTLPIKYSFYLIHSYRRVYKFKLK